jgi:ATP-dependent RNA helicase DeaD
MGLSPELLSGIEKLGFEKPTPIQEEVIPVVLETENDLVGLAQTGTGKTAAFGLPIIEQIDTSSNRVQALIVTPTRELCIQIANDLNNYAKHLKGVRIVPVYGGASIDTQLRALKKGAHIIAATPGRMLDLMNRRAADISQIKTVVLDEADEMLNMGFREELDNILKDTPKEKRTLLFSATMPKEVARIAKTYMHKPVEVTVGKQNSGAENVRHIYYLVHARNRYQALKRIADINPDIYGIVFCRTRMETKDVAEKLIKDGYNADALHGDLSQAQRDNVMKRFRNRSLQMLVATDVAARGIDVNDITHVINYNLPEQIEGYTHRSGRTGRAGKSGVSIVIANYREKSQIPRIEKIIGKKFEKLPIPGGVEICQKQLFNLIDRMEKVEVDEAQIAPFMDIVNKKLEWLSKEEIIKHFVSLEFNRFLDYYKNAPDLNEPTPDDQGGRRNRREKKEGRDGRDSNRRERRRSFEGGNFARFFINVGKKDGVVPKNIIGMINDSSNDRDIRIGDIDIKDSFSFFEVNDQAARKVLKSFGNTKFKGRRVNVEIAEADVGGRNNEHGKRKGKRKK